MLEQTLRSDTPDGITQEELREALARSLGDELSGLNKALLLVPDFTRYHSDAGRIANLYYHMLEEAGCHVELLTALGTHLAMSEAECRAMYGDIPYERFIVHNWRTDVVKLGEVPAAFVREVSEGLMTEPIDVEVNKRILDPALGLVLSIGQVVPHEVVGMANHSKNIFVGCGGSSMINASHMLGAFYGLERIMGKDHSPVRQVFDYAEQHHLADVPLCYALTVTTMRGQDILLHGLYIGRERRFFEQAVAHAQERNILFVDKPLRKAVVLLDEGEFKSTWLGNKSIYRTRMAIADGGELVVLAPGVDRCGEDAAIDALIRKYGYCGRENVIRLVEENADLRENLSAAAHLIHGSSDGRFSITYCTRHLSREEVEAIGFRYQPYDEAAARYNPAALRDGPNTLPDGEEIYYISNPALGLWADRARF